MTMMSSLPLIEPPGRAAGSLTSLSSALRQLQSAGTVAQLFEAAADAICVLGFERSHVSRVVDGHWVAVAAQGDADPGWTTEFAALHPDLNGIGIVDRRRPTVVSEVDPAPPRLHSVIGGAGWARSYLAAPIVPDGETIGFVYGGRGPQGKDVDEFDRDLLMLFAQGMGYLLQRTALAERIDLLRSALGDSFFPALDWRPPFEQGRRLQPVPTRVEPVWSTWQHTDELLTARERDIIPLIANGYTNNQIAHRLSLSEGTVKWHMKNILRKFDAPNRAAAVSAWLAQQGRDTHGPDDPRHRTHRYRPHHQHHHTATTPVSGVAEHRGARDLVPHAL